jgi:Holliday junction resolvase
MADLKVVPMPGDGPRSSGSRYARGAAFERKVAADLQTNGYVVVRAAGSHGKADVIGLKPGEVVLVQCKLGGPRVVRPPEWNDLFDMSILAGAIAVIASRPRRGHIEYARVLGKRIARPGVRLSLPAESWTPDRIIRGDEW